MKEEPNLIYLNQLSDGNEAIKNKLWFVLKEEFVKEVGEYNLNMKNYDFFTASENVHKIRHKIGFLGMQNAYDLSNVYQQNLTADSTALRDEFEAILKIIQEFVLKKYNV